MTANCPVCGTPTTNPSGMHGSCEIESARRKPCGHRVGVWCACLKQQQRIDLDLYYASEHDADSYRDA